MSFEHWECIICLRLFESYKHLMLHAELTGHDQSPPTKPKPTPTPTKPSILSEAAAIISGPRRDSYGPVEESFERVATVASIWLHRKLSTPLDAKDVAMLMLAVKMCRETNLPAYDNRLDAIGYLALLDQLHSANPTKEPTK